MNFQLIPKKNWSKGHFPEDDHMKNKFLEISE